MRMLFAAFLAIAAVSDAHAQDTESLFTITVPVELRNLPPVITRYSVTCSTHSPKEQITTGRTEGTFSGGSFIGDVVVETRRVRAFADPNTATEYSCALFLTGSDGRVYMSDAAIQFPRAGRAGTG